MVPVDPKKLKKFAALVHAPIGETRPLPPPEALAAALPEARRLETAERDRPLDEPLGLEALQALAQTEEGRAVLRAALIPSGARGSFAMFCREAWHTVEGENQLTWGWMHELVCAVLQAMFEDWHRAKRSPVLKKHYNAVRNLVMNLCPGSLKPVHVNGLVSTARGLVRAGDIEIGDRVVTHLGRLRPVLAVAKQGVLPTLTLETFRGRRVRCAPDHPVLTQRGWVNAEDVIVGDVLAEVHQTETTGVRGSLEEARLVGYLIGDGCMIRRTASFTNQDLESIVDFEHCARAVFLEPIRKEVKNRKGSTKYCVNLVTPRREDCARNCGRPKYKGNAICRECFNERERAQRNGLSFEYEGKDRVEKWLVKHDLVGKKSADKRVPKFIMEGDEETITEYLAAYWACDGGIQDRRDVPRKCRDNQVTNAVRLDAVTVSEGLAQDHLALLQRLGLRFSLRKQTVKLTAAMVGKDSTRVGEDYHSWKITATDQDTVAKFMAIVAPKIRHEKSRRAQGTRRSEFDAVLNADAVVRVQAEESAECVCFQIEEDSSFVYQGVAVHNSRIVSVFFPAWCWTRDPSMKSICLSVNEDAALRDARAMRQVIKSDWYQSTFEPVWTLKDDQDAISNFGNTKGGERLSRASGSEIVGLRADALILDDPNNPLDAQVVTERDKVNRLWSTNQQSRVNDIDVSMKIGVQQRVAVGDWTDFVIKKDGLWSPTNRGGWLWMVIPAEFDPKRKFRMPAELVAALSTPPLYAEDPREEEGESVDEVRLPKRTIDELRQQNEGTSYVDTQYAQRPSTEGGEMVKGEWFSFFELDQGINSRADAQPNLHARPDICVRPEEAKAEIIHGKSLRPGSYDFDEVVLSIDCAAKETKNGSQWGLGALARRGGRRYLLDDRTQRGSILTIVEEARDLIRIWSPDLVLIEDRAAGPDLRLRLETEMNKGDIPPVRIEPVPAVKGKKERMMVVQHILRSGVVALREGAPWLKKVVDEITGFPGYPTNDITDYVVQALTYWMPLEEDGGYRLVGF